MWAYSKIGGTSELLKILLDDYKYDSKCEFADAIDLGHIEYFKCNFPHMRIICG